MSVACFGMKQRARMCQAQLLEAGKAFDASLQLNWSAQQLAVCLVEERFCC